MESSEAIGNTQHAGTKIISSDESLENVEFRNNKDGENALVIQNGLTSINNITIEKSGDDDSKTATYYGTNAAVYLGDTSELTLTGGKITTHGKNSPGVFIFGSSTASLKDLSIETTGEKSNGIMTTSGAEVSGENLNVITRGVSSSPIYGGYGAGYALFMGGEYTSYDTDSPAARSMTDMTIEDVKLTANASEGIVIEGYHTTAIKDARVFSTDKESNSYSDSAESVLIYGSSQNATEEDTSIFQAENSAIITDKGSHFSIKNISSDIFLQHTLFVQNDAKGAFLNIYSSSVNLYSDNQDILGDITVDAGSSLKLNASNSYIKATLKGEGKKELYLSNEAVMVLTEDTHVDSLQNWAENYTNIYSNGYKLYVADQEIAINTSPAPESTIKYEDEFFKNAIYENNNRPSEMPAWGYVVIIGGVLIAVATIIYFYRNKFNKKKHPVAKPVAKSKIKPEPEIRPVVKPKNKRPVISDVVAPHKNTHKK